MRFYYTFAWLSLAHTLHAATLPEGVALAADNPSEQEYEKRCVVAANNDGTDDSPAIIKAFTECQKNGHIVFENTTYNIEKVMSFKDLDHVKVDIRGTLIVRLATLGKLLAALF